VERQAKSVRKVLGSRVRTLRVERGWSQEALGERSGLSGKFIGEVERGEKSISVDSLYRVSVALRVPLRDLVDISAGEPASPEYDRVLALLARHRSAEQLERAVAALRSALGET
jgi:XRE family transcriptional regulator, regulator of sulfur utilization